MSHFDNATEPKAPIRVALFRGRMHDPGRIHHETLIYRPTLAVRTLDNGVTLARIAAEGCDPLYWVMRWAERNKVVVVNVAYGCVTGDRSSCSELT
jgi:hypothetical protein